MCSVAFALAERLPLTDVALCRPQLARANRAVSWVPLAGTLAARLLELLQGAQGYYVYTSGS